MQLRELREYISRRDWKNAREYIDTGFSGAKASRPALASLMKDSAQRKFDCIVVYKIDRFGRSVPNLNQQLAALTSYGVRFIATTQSLDTDEKIPTSRLSRQILASVAEFEREMIRERTLSGIRAAQTAGKHVGRPKRIFRRDEVVRLRDEEGLSWRAIGQKLKIPAMTALDSYRQSPPCTETVAAEKPISGGKRRSYKHRRDPKRLLGLLRVNCFACKTDQICGWTGHITESTPLSERLMEPDRWRPLCLGITLRPSWFPSILGGYSRC